MTKLFKESGEDMAFGAHSSDTLGSSIYTELRQRIVDGRLAVGQRLREEELASALGVSRTPVREAIKRLESDGFVMSSSSRGIVVTSLTSAEAVELYAVRETLEGAAARFAAQHASSAEIHLLEGMLKIQREIGSNPDDHAKLNRQFHQAIYSMAHNRYLLDVLLKVQDHILLLPKTTYSAVGRIQTALSEHALIVEAIKGRLPEAAEEAARRHIREAQQIRMIMQFA